MSTSRRSGSALPHLLDQLALLLGRVGCACPTIGVGEKYIDVATMEPSNQPCQNGDSGQENLVLDQSSRSQIKQHRWPFPAEPGARIKPAQQPEVSGLIVEITVSEMALNFAGTFTVRGAGSGSVSDRLDRQRVAQQDVSQAGRAREGKCPCGLILATRRFLQETL